MNENIVFLNHINHIMRLMTFVVEDLYVKKNILHIYTNCIHAY